MFSLDNASNIFSHFQNFYFIYSGVLTECISIYHVCDWCPQRPEDENRNSGTGGHHVGSKR